MRYVAIQTISQIVDADTADDAAELLAVAPPAMHQSNLKIVEVDAIEQFIVSPAAPTVSRPPS
jgi:hypothetical protein